MSKIRIFSIITIALAFLGFLSGPAFSACEVVGDGDQMVELAVAANFAIPIKNVIENYFFTDTSHDYASEYKFNLCSGATGNFLSEIISDTAGHSRYDILFAANTAAPAQLVTGGFNAGPAATYVIGRLALFSNSSGPVIGPDDNTATTTLIKDQFGGQIVIADPVNAPYGGAAKQVLSDPTINANNQYVTSTGALTNLLYQVSDIGLVYTTVFNGSTTYPLGFVAASDICSAYTPTNNHIWMVNQSYYTPLQQAAVSLLSDHDPAATTGAQALLDYILSNAAVRTGLVNLYCYSLPPAKTTKTGKLNASPYLSSSPSLASYSLPFGVTNAVFHESLQILNGDYAVAEHPFSGRSSAVWR
ncbi:MAG: substrate-binding domain-containing protein [Deltaproteobacteria bacterium]|nr:substrate-binding domain-containing protein [Deltaproteobacteria bacterium]